MKLNSFIICEDVIRDINTDLVSLINICERVKVTSLPVFLHKLAIYIVFERSEMESVTQVFTGTMILKNNQNIIEKKDINFSIPKQRVRLISRFQGIALNEEGDFNVTIEMVGHFVNVFSIPVKKDGQQVEKD